jgi:predicted nuclease of predicted toxin-antitoxin system
MKFIIDAQLPFSLKKMLIDIGHDAIHTDDLSDKERTSDNEIREVSENQNRIVISKDADFVDSFYIKGIPKKLLLISTGNIKNSELFSLFSKNIEKIVSLFDTNDLVEMDNNDIIAHE